LKDWFQTSSEWQEVKTVLPVADSLVHLRINPGKDCVGVELHSIELRRQDAKPQNWHFGALD